ncbi:hypothetical protein [Streptomyces sp. NPDC088146]|uniref:hypothetical protein n=1 Tax=Streptomyces sp. NPDC088146 TaxID=3365829 RepID=UPI00380904A7
MPNISATKTAARAYGNGRSAIDLITPEDNIQWLFDSDVDNTDVTVLAAVLAESMNIPDDERVQLQQRRQAPLEVGTKGEGAGTRSVEPCRSQAPTGDAE